MNYQTVNYDSFNLIGISIRTTNVDGQSSKDIGDLWQRFREERIKAKIPNKISEEVVTLYTDYEGDFTKPYTVVIGCKVNSLEEVPEGMIGKTVPAAKYAEIPVTGAFPESLKNMWKKIWSSDLQRAYTNDFELYGSDFKETQEFKIYLSIK